VTNVNTRVWLNVRVSGINIESQLVEGKILNYELRVTNDECESNYELRVTNDERESNYE